MTDINPTSKSSCDTLLAELYTLDPSLKNEEGALREMLPRLLEKPTVSIDATFIARLRDELMEEATTISAQAHAGFTSQPTKRHDWRFWTYGLAPIAFVAIVLIAVIPGFFSLGTTPLPPTVTDDPSMMMFMQPNEQPAPGDLHEKSGDTSMMRMNLSAEPPTRIEVSSPHGNITRMHANRVFLDSAGYIVVRDTVNNEPGEILGTSEFLTTGTHDDVPIALSRTLISGELLSIALYTDNGDERFDLADDAIAINPDTFEPITVFVPVE